MRLETERLFLREMEEGDYDALYAVLADSDIMQHYPYTFDEKRMRNWITRSIERYKIFGFGLWAVCLKETGEMIGDCGMTMQNIGGVIVSTRKESRKKAQAIYIAAGLSFLFGDLLMATGRNVVVWSLAAMAAMFLCTGVCGFTMSLLSCTNREIRKLNEI